MSVFLWGLVLLCAWTLFAFAFGVIVGKVADHADETEQPLTFADVPRWDDTEEIRWDKRPGVWL